MDQAGVCEVPVEKTENHTAEIERVLGQKVLVEQVDIHRLEWVSPHEDLFAQAADLGDLLEQAGDHAILHEGAMVEMLVVRKTWCWLIMNMNVTRPPTRMCERH